MEDNWKHRSEGMRCETCVAFVRKVNSEGKNTVLGRCRQNAPTMRGFPAVFDTDWCMQHKLDENKV